MTHEKMTLTVAELVEYLNISKSAGYRLIHEKRIPHIVIGQQFRVPIKGVEAWLKKESEANLHVM